MKEGQKKIYYVVTQSPTADLSANPFMEAFNDSDVPVLIVSNQLDEMVFNQIGNFKNYTFVNVESGYEEIANDLKVKKDDLNLPSIPEEDVTNFCLWLKEHTTPYVGKVTLSQRLSTTPAVLFGQVSSNMRMIMNMMQMQSDDPAEMQKQMEAMSHNQTLEINPNHDIIIQLN
mmetsp:Transcript_29395/g.44422  ORF Transcript_29395/g.44422 Transcript_29395/m.44422 type:complete len:173 (+) Transcript_29395:1443-1961(+)